MLMWTKKWPDRAGWYWSKFYPHNAPGMCVRIIHILRNKHGRLIAGSVPLEELQCFGERRWAGPLYPPAPGAKEPGYENEENTDEDVDG